MPFMTMTMDRAACCVGDPTCVDCLTGLLPGLKQERRGSQGHQDHDDDDCDDGDDGDDGNDGDDGDNGDDYNV